MWLSPLETFSVKNLWITVSFSALKLLIVNGMSFDEWATNCTLLFSYVNEVFRKKEKRILLIILLYTLVFVFQDIYFLKQLSPVQRVKFLVCVHELNTYIKLIRIYYMIYRAFSLKYLTGMSVFCLKALYSPSSLGGN